MFKLRVLKVKFWGHMFRSSESKVLLRVLDHKSASPLSLVSSDLQRTLGLLNYFRKFVPDYTTWVNQINALLKKAASGHPIVWNSRCTTALQNLISYLETRPLLNHHHDDAL
jgi:hypothetical protein